MAAAVHGQASASTFSHAQPAKAVIAALGSYDVSAVGAEPERMARAHSLSSVTTDSAAQTLNTQESHNSDGCVSEASAADLCRAPSANTSGAEGEDKVLGGAYPSVPPILQACTCANSANKQAGRSKTLRIAGDAGLQGLQAAIKALPKDGASGGEVVLDLCGAGLRGPLRKGAALSIRNGRHVNICNGELVLQVGA